MNTYEEREKTIQIVLVVLCLTAVLVFAGAAVGLYLALTNWGTGTKNVDVSALELPDWVEVDLLPVNPYSRPDIPLEQINAVVIHYVGNPNTTAKANRNYFASLANGTGTSASSHFIVGLEGEVVQCVPLTEVAYASNQRNSDTVSIEVCHPDETGKFSDVTYGRVVELTAWLCESLGLHPEEDVIRHYDVTGKHCPRYYVEHPEAWEQFLKDVGQG